MTTHQPSDFLARGRTLRARGTPPLLLALALGATTGTVPTVGQAAEALEEIIVTANRRAENVQTVPVSIQVFSGADLENKGAQGFEDYLTSVASVGLTRSGSGSTKVGIRGVSNIIGGESGIGDSTSTVGLYLNDIPIQGTGPLPDLELYDLSRIEVLKGPQGTLYGEGAMGGAIKMILNAPDPGAFLGKAEANVSFTQDGGTNYGVKGAVNLPLGERAAARIVASYRDDGGFIDNSTTGKDDINTSSTSGVRGQLLWKLTDSFTAELLAMHQKLDQDDFAEQITGAGDLTSNLSEDRYNKLTFDLFGLTLRYDFGGAELVSSTSYWQNDRDRFDRSVFVGETLNFFLSVFEVAPPVAPGDPQGFTISAKQKSFTQEFRLASTGDQRLDWTVGAFYRSAKQDSVGYDTLQNIGPVNDVIEANFGPDAVFQSGLLFGSEIDEKFDQTALYGEITWGLTDKLDLTAGVRWFEEDLDLDQRDTAYDFYGIVFDLFEIPNPDVRHTTAHDSDTIGRIGLSYRMNERVMLYTMVSQGFRSGGPNYNGGLPGTLLPDLYKSDSLINYEIGAKTSWADGRVLANLALYYVDWTDVQVRANRPGLPPYIDNAGKARIEGGELQIIAAPTENLRAGLNVGLLSSKVTDLGPFTSGKVGAPLPNAPEATLSGFFEYSRPLGALGRGSARFDYTFVDKQAYALITAGSPESDFFLDSYDTGRLQFGIENERWSAWLFADNLWNARGITSAVSSFGEERLSVIRPRTIGVRVATSF